MKSVTVKNGELQKTIEANLEAHHAIFVAAMEGYQLAAIKWLSSSLQQLHDGETPRLYFGEPMPEDHTEDYKQVLAMLQWSVDDTIELSAGEFSQYVLDDWGWKKQWSATTSNYLT